MRSSLRAAAFAANAALIFATPSSVSEPCAQVSAALANNPSIDPTTGYPLVDIDTAYACLKSVPLQKSTDLQQLNGYKTLANFQSDLAYVKDPPPGWLYPGVDFMSSLDGIISNVQNEAYNSEYDAQLDLWSLVTSVYDFHVTMNTDILSILTWKRSTNLISLSTDGTSLPSVYDAADLFVLSGLNSSSYKPSPVVSINNTNVEQWLNQYATFEPWDHDPDANYNNIFYSVAVEGVPTNPNGRKFSQYFQHFPGSVTVLKFANGTTKNVQSYATTQYDASYWKGVTNGKSFYQTFCDKPLASGSASASVAPSSSVFLFSSVVPSASISPSASVSGGASSSSLKSTNNFYTAAATASPKPALPFFPEPLVKADDNSIAGFLPEGNSDLAVVTLPTFSPRDNYSFQNIFRTLLATAKSLGKTKLIIDVRGNNGGNVVDGYSLFKELFPTMTAWGGGNMAAWPLFNAMGTVVSELSGKKLTSALEELGALTEFYYGEDLKTPTTGFGSWSDFYGPVEHHGGEFTNVKHYNFSDPHNAVGLPDYGYANDTRPQPQTFSSENIVILSDGACGSTCAIFSELMKTQGGGSKGSNDQELVNLAQTALGVYQAADAQQVGLFKQYTNLAAEATQFLERVPNGANVNFQNNIRKGDDSATPLMFVYEASNCRFFYTPQMIADQSLVWSYAYNLQWGNGTCVKGSTGQPSAATGFSTGYINSPPPASAKNFFGANITWTYPGAYNAGESHQSSPSSSASAYVGPSSTAAPSAAASANSAASLGKVGGVVGVIGASILSAAASVFLN